jgi:mutator protein MutT
MYSQKRKNGVKMQKEIEEIIKPYKKNYIREIRKTIGHSPVMIPACGVIIENKQGEILLQQRSDNAKWGLPGGGMEIGETFLETAKREVYEEVGIIVENLELFGIYSGDDRYIVYPNQDICWVTSTIFKTSEYKGEILQATDETLGHRFFSRDNLPENINKYDYKCIEDWKRNIPGIIIN